MKSFIVANLDLNDKNPLYTLRDCLVKKWDIYSVESREKYLKGYKDDLNSALQKEDTSKIPKDLLKKIKEGLINK
jgi:hypothetical protein